MYEVIWHGRGGQGVVVAAQMLAEAAYLQEFKGVTFGPDVRTGTTRGAAHGLDTDCPGADPDLFSDRGC